MDDARGLCCPGSAPDGPGASFLRSGGEKSLQAQQIVARADHPVEPGLGQPHLCQKHLRLVRVELADFFFDFR